jgi:tungstate transport system substrate-binding protein
MATTTSVGNSGLLDALLPAYQRQHGVAVQAHLVGSGRALAMLAAGNADVVISHAPEAEAAALRAHSGWSYQKIMFNDFVIVGPAADVAGVRGAANAPEAMRRIAASGARFISRGDGSGTHEREQRLWNEAGARPARERLVAAGAGMGSTLRVASEAGAYTLTDRATHAQHAGALRLVILFEGGPELINTYAVVVDTASPRARDAAAFAEWLASGHGRDVIGAYRVAGTAPAFNPWPLDRPAKRPEDLPR